MSTKGEDAILWGKWEEDDLEYERLEERACPKPYWTEKQMKRRGEPQRKKMRRESLGENKDGRNQLEGKNCQREEKGKTKKMGMSEKKTEDEDGKEEAKELHQGKIGMKELRAIRAERREKWRIKKAIREKKQKGEGKETTGAKR